MIKNIIFDIGNVLAAFRWREVFVSLGFDKEEIEALAEATVKSNLWLELDRSARPDADIMADCIAAAPTYSDKIRLFFSHLSETVGEYSYAADWIRELKAAGYHVYLLSNYGKTVYGLTHTALSFLPLVDGGVFSYEVKSVKPERLIYETLLKKYDLAAKECLFFDDNPLNIEGARALGIHAALFTSLEQAKEDISRYSKEK